MWIKSSAHIVDAKVKLTFNFGEVIGEVNEIWKDEKGNLKCSAQINDLSRELRDYIFGGGRGIETLNVSGDEKFGGTVVIGFHDFDGWDSETKIRVKAPCSRCGKEGWIGIMKNGEYTYDVNNPDDKPLCEECLGEEK